MNTEHPREFHHCWRQALGRDTEAAVAAERRGDGEQLTPEPAQCPPARRRSARPHAGVDRRHRRAASMMTSSTGAR